MENINFKQIINNAYDPIAINDSQGKFIFINKVFANANGVNLHDFIGKNVKDLVKDNFFVNSAILEAVETKKVSTTITILRNGKHFLTTSIPIKDNYGNTIYIITNSRSSDIIEQFSIEIQKMKKNTDIYKNIVKYLSNSNEVAPIAQSFQMKQVLNYCNKIAKTDGNILINGESGVGKEVVAHYVHGESMRASNSFIPVNCAAIPNELFESEFFGYEGGAFTGSRSKGKIGLFQIANNGTLFLDEIGELPLQMQSKLLRVVETGEVQRIGSTHYEKTNMRIIAATNRNLRKMIALGKFREDLYYRLSVIPISIPPLRERSEDIIALSYKFLDDFNRKYNCEKYFTKHSEKALLNYNWPGNARELRNIIERAVIVATKDCIDVEFNSMLYLSKFDINNNDKDSTEDFIEYSGSLKEAVQQFEKNYIEKVLKKCNENTNSAADLLKIHRTTLQRKLYK